MRMYLPLVMLMLAATAASGDNETDPPSHPPSLDYPDGILLKVGTLKVKFGRSVYLSPRDDLRIRVGEGDHCRVMVLPSAYERDAFGAINKDTFPCEFGEREVVFSHHGARSPSTTHISMQIRYDSATHTYVIPIRMPVETVFVQRQIVTSSMYLTVDALRGTSEPIDNHTLGFSYDPSTESCRIATLAGTGGLPRYGHLINDPSRGVAVFCEEFLSAGVRYKHDATTRSPDRDDIPMLVELQSDYEISKEYFQVSFVRNFFDTLQQSVKKRKS